MPPKTQQKTKEQKAAAAMAGGKSRKKKWSKEKRREKVQNQVLFSPENYKRLKAEVPKTKLITPSALVERLKITGSLARKALKELEEENLIKNIVRHGQQLIYTRKTTDED